MSVVFSCKGNRRWVTALDNIFHDEFASSTKLPWATIESGTEAGWVRFAGGGGATAGKLKYSRVRCWHLCRSSRLLIECG